MAFAAARMIEQRKEKAAALRKTSNELIPGRGRGGVRKTNRRKT